MRVARFACASLLLTAAVARAQSAPDVLQVSGVTTGVAIHVGVTDGQLEADLAGSGRILVHGLAMDAKAVGAARTLLRGKGLYGVASVEQVPGEAQGTAIEKLPYPDHFAALVIADLDALAKAGPSETELTRITAPEGVLYLKKSGQWTKTIKPMPADMAEWSHPFGSASNNSVSHDQLVKPITTVKWIDSYAHFSLHMSGAGFPVAGSGVLVHDMRWSSNEAGKKRDENRLVCRDAFSGVVRWQQPTKDTTHWMVISGDKVLSTHLPSKGPSGLYVYDLQTGKPQGSIPAAPEVKGKSNEVFAVARDGVAYVASGPTLQAVDLTTLKPRWTYTPDEIDSFFSPTISEDGGKLVVTENIGGRYRGRWNSATVAAITCLDTATGKPLWKNTEVKGAVTGYTPVAGNRVLYYAPWGILSQTFEYKTPEQKKNDSRYFGVLDLATGKRLWQKDWKDADGTGNLSVQIGFIRDGVAWLSSPDWIMGFDINTGQRTKDIRTSVVNQRCIRTRATDNFMLMGFGTFLDKAGKYTDQNITRSGCAVGSTPAYGMVYQTADGCGCFSQLRGFSGLATEEPTPAVPDSLRLEKVPGPPEPAGYAVAPMTPAVTVTSSIAKGSGEVATVRVPVITDQPVRDSWINTEVLPYPETAPVKMPDGRELVAVVNEHRLECRQAGKVLWSATADARISGDPLLHNARVYFAAHDGYVYCLDEKTGARQWRFLVAPGRRHMMAYGQLESAWPIRNVVLHNGLICAAAGRHPELDGGIALAGLDPASGAAKWTGRIAHDTAHEWFSVTDAKRIGKNLNWVTNGGLRVDNGKLLLDALDHAHGGGNKVDKLDPFPIDPANPPTAPAPGR